MPLQTLSYKFLKTVLVFGLWILTAESFGQAKNFEIDTRDPAWIVKIDNQGLKPKAKDIDDGYFLALFENQTHVELQEEYTHIIKEIATDAGVQNGSQISVTYDPGFQKLIFHKIRVWRNGKPDDQLKKHKFKILQNEKDLSKFIYRGTYDAFLLLNDIRKGDRIEYAYTIKGNNPIYGNKFAATFYLEGGSSIGYLYNNLIFSKNRHLNLKNFNFNNPAKISEKDGMKLYEWEDKLTKTQRTTDFEPSWYDPQKRIQITEYKNWNEVVNWGLSVNEYPQLKTPSVAKKANELFVASAGDTTRFIESAIRFVQDEIRYMGIEMGVYSHRPNSPEKIIQQRYGDCKDKSLLLTYLLKEKGVVASMAYLDTYTTIKTDASLPSPFIFNHVVVRIDYKNKKHWIDPTISYQRGKLDQLYFPNYGYALVIKKGVNALEKVSRNDKSRQISNLVFQVADTGSTKSSTLMIKTRYTGHYADNMRAELAESGTDEIEKSYAEYYAELYTDTEVKAPIQVHDDEAANTLEITEQYNIDNIWEEDTKNGAKYITLYGDLIRDQLRKVIAKNRTAPLALKYPTDLEQIITVHMPYETSLSDGTFKIENEYYHFSLDLSRQKKTQNFHYRLKSLKPYIEGSAVKSYAKDREKIAEYLTYYLERSHVIRGFGLNALLILIFILSCIFSGLFFIKSFRKSAPFDLEKIEYAVPIRGWLIILGIRIASLPIATLLKQALTGFFNQDTWDGLKLVKQEYYIKSIFIAESVAFALLTMGSIMCLIQFFNKRESFPRQYIRLSIALITFTLLDFLAGMLIRHWTGQTLTDPTEVSRILMSVAISVIWILYLQKSVRVQQTFVFTYPDSEWRSAASKKYNEQLYLRRSAASAEKEIENYNTEPILDSENNHNEKF
jgi:transglutaminase-like putative cysteine protease